MHKVPASVLRPEARVLASSKQTNEALLGPVARPLPRARVEAIAAQAGGKSEKPTYRVQACHRQL